MRSELDVKTAKAILNYLDVEDFPNPLANIISEAYAPLVNSHASNLRKVEALRDALRELVRVVDGSLQGYGVITPAIEAGRRALALDEEQL